MGAEQNGLDKTEGRHSTSSNKAEGEGSQTNPLIPAKAKINGTGTSSPSPLVGEG
jgi:hypothetical protein